MKFLSVLLAFLLVLGLVPVQLFAEINEEVGAKIQTLENQISTLQTQLDELKKMVTSQSKEKDELVAKVKTLEEKNKPFLARATKPGGFKLRDALGLA